MSEPQAAPEPADEQPAARRGWGRVDLAPQGPPTLPVRIVSYLLLFVLGLLLGVVGSLHVQSGPSIGPLLLSYGVVLGVLGNAAAPFLSRWTTQDRWGAAAPAVGWLVVIVALNLPQAAGDVLFPASVASFVFLAGGSLAAAMAVTLAPLRRPPPEPAGTPVAGSAARRLRAASPSPRSPGPRTRR